MNWKKFFSTLFVGFITYWLAGGLFYAFVFKSFLPEMPEEQHPDMMKYIFLGCVLMTLLLTYIFNFIGGLTSLKNAIVHGTIICVIVAATMHTFYFQEMPEWNMIQRLLDIAINGIMGALTSLTIFHVSKLISKS